MRGWVLAGLPANEVRLNHVFMSLVVAALLAFPFGAGAQDEEAGSRVLRADQTVDLQSLLMLAEQGDARASFLLGTHYASGRAGVQDDSEAVRWFTKAAEKGLAEAEYNLGIMYAQGRGVATNMARAAHWFEQAAKQGLADAQYNIGTFYGLGIGVPKDEKLAADWLGRAAEKGLPQAEFNLGVLYEHGRGVRIDGEAAMSWYEKAARKGYEPAADRLAALAEKMRSGEPLTPSALGATAPAQSPGAAATQGDGTPAAHGAVHSNEWVRSLNPEFYTLQLISHRSEKRSTDFIVERKIAGQAAYFVSRRGDKTWYSVIYGLYPSYDDAEAAARALPPELSDLEPWVRKLRMIQASITP